MIKNCFYMLKIVWGADKKNFLFRILYVLYNTIPTFLRVFIFKIIIDSIEKQEKFYNVIIYISAFALIEFTTRIFASIIFNYQNEILSIKVSKKLNIMLLEKISSLDIEVFDDPVFNNELIRAVKEADNRAMIVYNQFFQFINNILCIIISFSIIIYIDPLLLLIAVFTSIIFYFLDILFVKKKYLNQNKLAIPERKINYFKSVFYDRKTIFDIKQYFGLKNIIENKYVDSCHEKINIKKRIKKDNNIKNFVQSFLVVIINYLIPLGYIAYQGIKRIISYGDVGALWSSFNLFNNSVSEVSRNVSNFKESSLFVKNFRRVMEYKPIIEKEGGEKTLNIDKIESIEFKNVSFKYPFSEKLIINDVSFSVFRSQKLAIVGLNGVGKTTLIKLIMRFYDVSEGEILINNINIKKYDVKQLRKHISSIFQDFQLYSISIAEQISCETEYKKDKIIDALKKTGIYEKIEQSELKINSQYTKMFSKEGLILSGGEIQKLALSRLLYKNGSCFIMDEPSSMLDPISERKLNKLIQNFTQNKILILISHRLSTTKDADKIIYIEEGKIIESGNHRELIKLGAKYSELFNTQAKGYTNGN